MNTRPACPFCGNADQIRLTMETIYHGSYGSGRKHDEIRCTQCGAHAPVTVWGQRADFKRGEPAVWARDLDGTGSLHMCAKGDPNAEALYL